MKFHALYLIALLPALCLADVLVGADIRYTYNATTTATEAGPALPNPNPETKQRTSDAEIQPQIGMFANDKIEIDGYLIIGYSYQATYSNGDMSSRARQLNLGLGGGMYYYLIDTKPFSLSIGPDLYFRYWVPKRTTYGNDNESTDDGHNHITTGIGAPIHIDFHLTNAVRLRLSSRLLGFDVDVRNQTNSTYEQRVTSINIIDIKTALTSPWLGLFFEF